MSTPDWAQPGRVVAVQRRDGAWISAPVSRVTKARVFVIMPGGPGKTYEASFAERRGVAWWDEYGTGAYHGARMHDIESDVAKAGLRLSVRRIAGLNAHRAAKDFLNISPSSLTIEDADRLISALSHFAAFIKAQEANAD